MKTFIYITLFINFVGVVQATTLSGILIARGKRNKLNYVVTGLLLVLAIAMLNTIRILSGFRDQFLVLQDISNAVIFLLGPLLYALVSKAQIGVTWFRRNWHHFLLCIIYLLISLSLRIAVEKYGTGLHFRSIFQNMMIVWIWNLQTFAYVYVSYGKVKISLSKKEKDSQWLKNLLQWFMVILLINFVLMIINQYVSSIPEEITLNVTVLLSFVVAWIMFKSAIDPIASVKKENIKISSGTVFKLKRSIEEDKIYRKPSITLKEFSSMIEEPSYVVSKAIKKHYGLTFPELINKFRITDIIQKLATEEGEELKIESIAYEYGFNTPSAFYSAFKKETSLTPKEFRLKNNSGNE